MPGLFCPTHETTCSGQPPMVDELEVAIDGRTAGATQTPWTMGSPCATLRWLGTRLAEQGLQLRQGQVILTGSALPLFPMKPGSRVVALAGPLGTSSVVID